MFELQQFYVFKEKPYTNPDFDSESTHALMPNGVHFDEINLQMTFEWCHDFIYTNIMVWYTQRLEF